MIWHGTEGAANQVRQAVAYLMDEHGAIKSAPDVFLSLYNCIEEFERKGAKNTKILLPAQWLGNSGDHAEIPIRDDVFDAFDVIEIVPLASFHKTTIMAKVKRH